MLQQKRKSKQFTTKTEVDTATDESLSHFATKDFLNHKTVQRLMKQMGLVCV